MKVSFWIFITVNSMRISIFEYLLKRARFLANTKYSTLQHTTIWLIRHKESTRRVSLFSDGYFYLLVGFVLWTCHILIWARHALMRRGKIVKWIQPAGSQRRTPSGWIWRSTYQDCIGRHPKGGKNRRRRTPSGENRITEIFSITWFTGTVPASQELNQELLECSGVTIICSL